MATLKQLMTADVAGVFFNTAEFARSDITHYPGADLSAGVTITAIDVPDGLEGTRELPGDGRRINSEDGTSRRESRILEISTTISVAENDLFEIDGERWTALRVIGEDEDLASWLLVRKRIQSRLKGQPKQ